MDYFDIENQLQTGDVVLFGATYGESKWIEEMTGAPFSHSGLILRLPKVDNEIYFWESVTETRAFADPEEHNLKHMGARVVRLRSLLPYYTPYTNGQFTLRQLVYNRTPEFQAGFEAFVRATDKTPFPPTVQMAINYLLGHFKNFPSAQIPYNIIDPHRKYAQVVMYCAQLIAGTYQSLNLLPAAPPDNFYAPADFAAVSNLQLLNGASLAPEVAVKWTGKTVQVAASA